jgi:DNA-directed RNA polymerase specialized sigma24 family protein
MPPDEPISRWILDAKEGDSLAIQRLWDLCFDRLVCLARRKLGDSPRRSGDEEDVALSAFASFCHAAEKGRLPELMDRHGLWNLLFSITAQKAVDRMRHEGRQKRGAGRVLGESKIGLAGDAAAAGGMDRLADDCPPPDFAVMMAEQCTRLLDQLNANLRPVALAKIEGSTNEEIARRLDCSLSTVERSLRLIRKIWQADARQEAG